jgi:molybdenum cofactor cytidylyltransferase
MAAALTLRVGCIVLAAGAGRRFGGDKLIATLRGRPVLQYAVDAACGARTLSCTLVLGDGAARILAAVDPRRCAVVLNAEWRSGIASSIGCGLRAHSEDDACIVMAGDTPFAASADLDRLIAAWGATSSIVALRAGSVWGAPVLFPRRDFAALRALEGDAGAKRHAAQQRERLIFVDAEDRNAFADIDTQDDLKRLSGSETRRTPRLR